MKSLETDEISHGLLTGFINSFHELEDVVRVCIYYCHADILVVCVLER